jgi:hypothetical protein
MKVPNFGHLLRYRPTLHTTTRKNRSNPSTATTLDSSTSGHLFRYLTPDALILDLGASISLIAAAMYWALPLLSPVTSETQQTIDQKKKQLERL